MEVADVAQSARFYPIGMYDEILEACARDELRDTGADEDSIDEALAAMRDAGMFEVPEW